VNRRSFLRRAGCLSTALFAGCIQRTKTSDPRRYVINATDISEQTRERIEIIHDLPKLDLVVGYVAPELVESAATFRDSKSFLSPEMRIYVAGNANISGEDLYELQWDKNLSPSENVTRRRVEAESLSVLSERGSLTIIRISLLP